MSDNKTDDRSVEIKHLADQVELQRSIIASLQQDSLKLSGLRAQAIVEADRVEKKLKADITSLVNSYRNVAVAFAAAATFLGALGIQHFIDNSVEQLAKEAITVTVDEVVNTEIETIRDKLFQIKHAADEQLNLSIEKLQRVEDFERKLGKNELVVLQTDFGSQSPYMGLLKGAIYQINPQARIDVITEEVPQFSRLGAAWMLARAIQHYPHGTIFVSITGQPKESAKRPKIIRTKERGYVLVGYFNGVFDLVVDSFGVDTIYEVDWDAYLKELRELQGDRISKSDSTLQEDPLQSDFEIAEILGYLAGSVSSTHLPWDLATAANENPNAEGAAADFHWNRVVREENDYLKDEDLENDMLVRVDTDTAKRAVEIKGVVMHIDRFGNANTNIPASKFKQAIEVAGPAPTFGLGIRSKESAAKLAGDSEPTQVQLDRIAFFERIGEAKEKGEPLITFDSQKVQLAKFYANFSTSNEYLIDTEGPVQAEMHVTIRIEPGSSVRHVIKRDDS